MNLSFNIFAKETEESKRLNARLKERREGKVEEIDLEIAIRQRIAETIQSRMTWALLLQESVQRSFGQGALHFAYSGEPAKPP